MSLHSMEQFSGANEIVSNMIARTTIEASTVDETLLDQFDTHFQAITADTKELIHAAHKIRYQVYCIEHPHEEVNNPDCIECDEFDSHAAHSLIVQRFSNKAMGTVRLVLPVPGNLQNCFPVQRVLDAESTHIFDQLPLHTTAEVSRFSISRALRRSAAGAAGTDQTVIENSGPLMRLGLIQALVRMSAENGITHWCAAMEPTLLRMLSAMGIRFRAVGPLVEYHGLRQPCYCVVSEVLETVKRERPAFWAVLTDGGMLSDENQFQYALAS